MNYEKAWKDLKKKVDDAKWSGMDCGCYGYIAELMDAAEQGDSNE